MQKLPVLSVVICSYNRAEMLADTLKSLISEGTDPEKYELIVIDNNSTDNTSSTALTFAEKHPEFNIRYVFEPRQGLSFARNRGIEEAKSEIVAFFDDDIIAGKYLIRHWITFFENRPDAAGGGGKIAVHFDAPRPSWMPEILLTLFGKHDYGESKKLYRKGRYPFGGNMAYRKELLKQAGMFNTDLGRKGTALEGGEEKDLFYKISRLNPNVFYVPQARLKHRAGAQRLTKTYIKGQALGIGKSIRVMLQGKSLSSKLSKLFSEFIKFGASLMLLLGYFLILRPAKGITVLQFRFWIWKGYLAA